MTTALYLTAGAIALYAVSGVVRDIFRNVDEDARRDAYRAGYDDGWADASKARTEASRPLYDDPGDLGRA